MIASCLHSSSLSYAPRVLQEALEVLTQTLEDGTSEGRIEVDGDRLYVNFMEFQSKPAEEQAAEKHEEYIDIHYLIEGNEVIGWSPFRPGLVSTTPYDAEADFALFEPQPDEILMPLQPGMFMVFFPDDIHRPGMGNQTTVKKAVIKIHKNLLNHR